MKLPLRFDLKSRILRLKVNLTALYRNFLLCNALDI